ncbi:MAG: hypothetical protein U0L74_07825 [Paludibacteraceae bacterium]|nr:hypothetical protein [Paludibacteraceae bacterium]
MDEFYDYYDEYDYERETFYALSDGMCGDYEDWEDDISSLKEYLGLD